MALNDSSSDAEEIAAKGAADVARLAAWHGLTVDLAVVGTMALLAYRGIIAPEAVIGVLGGVTGARLATRARGSADGAILPMLVGAWPRK